MLFAAFFPGNIKLIKRKQPAVGAFNQNESDVASNLLHSFLSASLYYTVSSSDKNQRKKSLSPSL